MRILKVISCAILCAFIILLSCISVFAEAPPGWNEQTGATTPSESETSTVSPKTNYSQMTDAQLLDRGQVPISWLLEDMQKQIDKTVKNGDGEEERVYSLFRKVKQDDGTYESELVPVGKFNLVNFLQDKKFILDYRAYADEKSDKKYKPAKRDESYIFSVTIFDDDPTLDVLLENPKDVPKDSPDIVDERFYLITKPSLKINTERFSASQPNTMNQSFSIKDETKTAATSGVWATLIQYNSILEKTAENSSWKPVSEYVGFYLNFMPEGGDGKLNNFVVTDKDISSEKQYDDDPNRPDGNYKYAIYEFQNDKMTAAQYFTEKPEVYKKDSGSSVQYEVLFNRFKAESGEIIDRQNWEFWMPENETYIWLTIPDSYSTPSKTPATYHYTDDSPDHTSVKFSWEPFVGYDGEIYEDNAVLVDGNGFVPNRPTGSYPYVIKRYVNSQLYETFFFQYAPYVNITDIKKNYDTAAMTAKIFVCNVGSSDTGGRDNLWYSKKQDVFFVPSKSGSRVTQLRETYDFSIRYVNGIKSGDYLTFNWDAGKASDEANQFALFYEKNGDNLDDFYEEFEGGITDGEGNPVGQGDGSKPGQNKNDSGFDFDGFEFNSDSLWKYATEFLNFCKNVFSVLPSFIWQIIATGAVIVVILRILSR